MSPNSWLLSIFTGSWKQYAMKKNVSYLKRSHLIIVAKQPWVKLSLLSVLFEVLPFVVGLGR